MGELATTTITTEIPTTTITTEIPTTTPITEIPTTTFTTEIPTTTTPITEIPSTTNASSSPARPSKAVLTPRKFLPDETQGEFLPVASPSVDFSTVTEEGSGEFLIEDTTEYEIGSGEMW